MLTHFKYSSGNYEMTDSLPSVNVALLSAIGSVYGLFAKFEWFEEKLADYGKSRVSFPWEFAVWLEGVVLAVLLEGVVLAVLLEGVVLAVWLEGVVLAVWLEGVVLAVWLEGVVFDVFDAFVVKLQVVLHPSAEQLRHAEVHWMHLPRQESK